MRRAPRTSQLHSLLQQEQQQQLQAMAATRRVWQRCVRALTGGVSPCPGAGAGAAASQSSKPLPVKHRMPQLAAWEGGTPSGRFFSSPKRFNLAAFGSSISLDEFHVERFSRLNAMQFSTLPETDQNVTENSSTESPTLTETVVVQTEVSVSEFVPEIENTPSTPLVQAIQSQESTFVEGSSSSAAEISRLGGGVLSDIEQLSPGSAPSVPTIDTERVVQPGRIYIGGLPFGVKGDALKDGLRELCGKYGTVQDVSLAQHRNQSLKSIEAGKHRGFAFVTMETPEQAQEVIDNLHGASAWGRVMMVSYGLRKVEPDPSERLGSTVKSLVRCKVFVGNLHEGTSRLDLVNKFQQYGTIVDVKLITELHSSRSRGFGFVTFAEEGQAVRAVLDSDGAILDGSVIRVNIAKYPQGY